MLRRKDVRSIDRMMPGGRPVSAVKSRSVRPLRAAVRKPATSVSRPSLSTALSISAAACSLETTAYGEGGRSRKAPDGWLPVPISLSTFGYGRVAARCAARRGVPDSSERDAALFRSRSPACVFIDPVDRQRERATEGQAVRRRIVHELPECALSCAGGRRTGAGARPGERFELAVDRGEEPLAVALIGYLAVNEEAHQVPPRRAAAANAAIKALLPDQASARQTRRASSPAQNRLTSSSSLPRPFTPSTGSRSRASCR